VLEKKRVSYERFAKSPWVFFVADVFSARSAFFAVAGCFVSFTSVGDYHINYELNASDITKIEEELKSNSHEVRLDAAKFLGRALFDPSKAVREFVVDGECVNLLMVGFSIC
jgi:hypothetical protein